MRGKSEKRGKGIDGKKTKGRTRTPTPSFQVETAQVGETKVGKILSIPEFLEITSSGLELSTVG
jgi:hypothetical protein